MMNGKIYGQSYIIAVPIGSPPWHSHPRLPESLEELVFVDLNCRFLPIECVLSKRVNGGALMWQSSALSDSR